MPDQGLSAKELRRIWNEEFLPSIRREIKTDIDPLQKWLPLNYSFVHIQNSLTNLARDNNSLEFLNQKRG